MNSIAQNDLKDYTSKIKIIFECLCITFTSYDKLPQYLILVQVIV
jgi:hypothetical protein